MKVGVAYDVGMAREIVDDIDHVDVSRFNGYVGGSSMCRRRTSGNMRKQARPWLTVGHNVYPSYTIEASVMSVCLYICSGHRNDTIDSTVISSRKAGDSEHDVDRARSQKPRCRKSGSSGSQT